ncbi:tRNA A64-2'-O-ribosylphosphate transferase [Gloeopeniophorella convolvens]|nr:tRNA A64-2'-O-ribosylphosphate transferase [Gloeopeniophorella convolvens]
MVPFEDTEATVRAYLRRESLDVYNRLHSVEADVAFVNDVRMAYPSLPLIPNLRCGAWYTDPAISYPAPAYFKSTDGHHGNWSFNLRRPNLHLLPIITAQGGLILVDSTRAGKRLPDALSKTVPIWCAVVNRALRLRGFVPSDNATKETEDPWDAAAELHTPPDTVSAHEHAQIATRLDGWAANLAGSSYTLPELSRPLRPLWITPASAQFPQVPPDAPFLPIICVSASRVVDAEGGVDTSPGRRAGGFAYVQGSGDDHELWGQSLTPELFWKHHAELLACSRSDLEALVARIVTAAQDTEQRGGSQAEWNAPPTPVARVGGTIQLCALADLPRDLPAPMPAAAAAEEAAFVVVHESDAPVPPAGADNHTQPEEDSDGIIQSDVTPSPAPASKSEDGGGTLRVLHLYLPPGKRGKHALLHGVLPRATTFARPHLMLGRVVCVAGGDAAAGVALALLQIFFDDAGRLRRGTSDNAETSKRSVRTRLEWIIASRPQANPSRTTLKRVNEFLLSPRALSSGGEAR